MHDQKFEESLLRVVVSGTDLVQSVFNWLAYFGGEFIVRRQDLFLYFVRDGFGEFFTVIEIGFVHIEFAELSYSFESFCIVLLALPRLDDCSALH